MVIDGSVIGGSLTPESMRQVAKSLIGANGGCTIEYQPRTATIPPESAESDWRQLGSEALPEGICEVRRW
jgi:hypothetical protein